VAWVTNQRRGKQGNEDVEYGSRILQTFNRGDVIDIRVGVVAEHS